MARLLAEVLMALGKHWDRASERGDATGAQLVSAWLRAEQAKELTVLRAHQVRGAALRWLLGLAASEGLLVRLVSPEPPAGSSPWGAAPVPTAIFAGITAIFIGHPTAIFVGIYSLIEPIGPITGHLSRAMIR